ncbi:MAG: TetR/AcrR family transcriptional regulator [Coriobacteriia bacterium]
MNRFFAEEEPGRRGEILDAALTVFTERGYEGGSMRSIADRVGVTEPALYRHFSGKEAIFIALLRLTGGRLRSEALGLVEALEAENIREQILAAFADRRAAIRRYAPLLQALAPSVSRNPRFLSEFRSAVIEPVLKRITEKVREIDSARGLSAEKSAETVDARIRALLALLVGYFVTSFVLEDAPDEQLAEAALLIMGWSDADGKRG